MSDIEALVLCTVLLDSDSLKKVQEILKPEHFQTEAHSRIFEACVELSQSGGAVDIVAVASWLRDRELLSMVGGPSYLAQLADMTPVCGDVASYARSIRDRKANFANYIELKKRTEEEAHEATLLKLAETMRENAALRESQRHRLETHNSRKQQRKGGEDAGRGGRVNGKTDWTDNSALREVVATLEAENAQLRERQDQMNRIALENEKVLNRALDDATATQTTLASALRDNAALTEQLTAAQDAGTKAVEANRLRLENYVRAFHRKFNVPMRETPGQIELGELRLGLRLAVEEFFEVLSATCRSSNAKEGLRIARTNVEMVISGLIPGDPPIDLEATVDGIGDTCWTLIGLATRLGVNMQPIEAEIARSNMSKEPCPNGGKFRKPDGWVPPDIEGKLREQGMRS